MEIVEYNFRGTKFKAVKGDWLAKSIAANKYYDRDGLAYSKQFIKKNSVVIDAGANIGNHSLFYLKECNCSFLHAFEPHPFMFRLLTENLSGYKNKILHQNGLSDKETKVSASIINEKHVGSTTYHSDVNGKLVLKTIDSFNMPKVDFIKIDVEGYEYEVINGAKNTIKRCRPTISVEVREVNSKSAGDNKVILRETASSVIGIMKSLNYKLVNTMRIGATQMFWCPNA